jgi:tetratricopeptide (TPR) repeat protein
MSDKKNSKDLLEVKKNVDGNDVKGLKALLGAKERDLDNFLEKTQDKMDVGNWLKKANKHEQEQEYTKAIESYLHFMEAKLEAIDQNPKESMNDYYALVNYYIKIAECYTKVTHTSLGGKQRDMENAGKYYTIAAKIYLDRQRYDEAFKAYEKAAACYAEVESYINAANTYMDAAALQNSAEKKLLACTCTLKAAEYYEKAQDYVNACKAYLAAGQINEEIKDIYGAMNAYKKAGECNDKLGKPKEAIQYYLKSAELSSSVDRYSEVAQRYSGIAKSYENLKDWESAIFYHLRAAELNKGNDELASSYNFDNVAKCYKTIGNIANAIEFYHKSLSIRVNEKKYSDAAAAAYEIAKIHEQLNDYENAAKMYFQNGEYAASARQKTSDGFAKSAAMYQQMAEQDLKEGKTENAEANYLEAAKSYDRLNDKKRAAELYEKLGEIESKNNYEKSVQHYVEAAARYSQTGENNLAANTYLKAKDYLSAAKNYSIYAQSELKKSRFYYAANGYRKAADTYSKLKKQSDSRDSYIKAVHNYSQYIERAAYIKSEDKEMNAGNANKKIAECYIELDETPVAKNFLEKARNYFTENKNEKELQVIEALINITDIDLALKAGDYEKGKKLLDKTLISMDEIIISAAWPQDYLEFLQRNKEKINEAIARLQIKPDIELVIEEAKKPYTVNEQVTIKAKITNKSKYAISNLYFITTLPQELSATKEPEQIPEMKENETLEIEIDATARGAGKFSFAPLEMLYKDKNGNKYMKSSNEIIIEISEPPQQKK